MNFDQAIECHVQWKSKLAAYLVKPDDSLNATTIAGDSGCDLGKWIHGEGLKYVASPEFGKLAADHERFHKAAADIVRKTDAGQKMAEEIALGSQSEYARASNAVVTSLMKMKIKVAGFRMA
jgi:Chemoreceptor zinc-binding domain